MKTTPQQVKHCSGCDQDLPRGRFAPKPSKTQPNKVHSRCRVCQALYRRGRRYGLLLSETQQLVATGQCAICRDLGTDIDHDHKTGRVRGLLCGKCNRGLALFKDDPTRLLAAVDYLAAQGRATRYGFSPPQAREPGDQV